MEDEDLVLLKKKTKPSQIDNFKPILTTTKTFTPNIVKCNNLDTNQPLSSSQEIANSEKKSNEKETQQIISTNEKESNEEKTQEQSIQPVISEISVKPSTFSSINLKQANKVLELMDVESKIDSSNESSDDIEEAPGSNFAVMLHDFIDSD